MIAESHTKLGTENLPLRGWQRARALVRFFGLQSTAKGDNGLTPDVVFAPRVGPRSKSARAIEIVTPLLGETRPSPMIAEHLKGDHSAPIADLMDSGIARVACEHKEILDRQVDGWPCRKSPSSFSPRTGLISFLNVGGTSTGSLGVWIRQGESRL